MQHPDDNLYGFISPDELPGGSSSIGYCARCSTTLIIESESEFLDVHPKLLIGDAPIEVLIHLPHDLVDLMLRDGEAESLQQVLELVTLYETVLICVNLMENLR